MEALEAIIAPELEAPEAIIKHAMHCLRRFASPNSWMRWPTLSSRLALCVVPISEVDEEGPPADRPPRVPQKGDELKE